MQDRVTIRMSPELIERLDEWIAAQPGYISRQEAMRRLASFALDQGCPVTSTADGARDEAYTRPVRGNDPLSRTS